MKKIFKNLLIGLIWIVILFFLLNFIIYKFFYYQNEGRQTDFSKEKFSVLRQETDYKYVKEHHITREPIGTNINNKSIVIFGCSYAYGFLLEQNQTLGYKLSKMLNRPVYNFAHPGEAPQFVLMKIRSHEYDEVLKNCEYVIFVTIGEHLFRVHSNSGGWSPAQTWPRCDIKNKNGSKYLSFHKYRFAIISDSYFWRYLRKIWFTKILPVIAFKPVQDYLFDNIKIHFETIKKELEEYNPDIKMIIIVYQDGNYWHSYLDSPRWKELEDDGIIVLKEKDIIKDYGNPIYYIPNDGHPSELVWDKIADYMVNQTTIFKN